MVDFPSAMKLLVMTMTLLCWSAELSMIEVRMVRKDSAARDSGSGDNDKSRWNLTLPQLGVFDGQALRLKMWNGTQCLETGKRLKIFRGLKCVVHGFEQEGQNMARIDRPSRLSS